MSTPQPDLPESEDTPLVRQLLDINRQLQIRIQELEDEILRLKVAVYFRCDWSSCLFGRRVGFEYGLL